jgi:hypothetical protein
VEVRGLEASTNLPIPLKTEAFPPEATQNPTFGPDFREIAAVWENLPPAVRAAILGMVRSAISHAVKRFEPGERGISE